MNVGDQACPETRPGPRPNPGYRRPVRTRAGKTDGTDVLLGNVESQHRQAARLNTHANAYCERLIGSLRRECLDWLLVLNERHLRMVGREWAAHYNHGRPHRSLGPGIPAPQGWWTERKYKDINSGQLDQENPRPGRTAS
jgi:Integrase core domain